jgi:hypothetical protein
LVCSRPCWKEAGKIVFVTSHKSAYSSSTSTDSLGAYIEKYMPFYSVAANCTNKACLKDGISLHNIPYFNDKRAEAKRRRKVGVDFVCAKRLYVPSKTARSMLGSICSDLYARIYMLGSICSDLYARIYMLGSICSDLYARIYMLGSICPDHCRTEDYETQFFSLPGLGKSNCPKLLKTDDDLLWFDDSICIFGFTCPLKI